MNTHHHLTIAPTSRTSAVRRTMPAYFLGRPVEVYAARYGRKQASHEFPLAA